MSHRDGAQFWFRSSLFEIEPGEDEETNPLYFGRQLATWLRAKLVEKGYAPEEVIAEDWGWCVVCSRKPFMLWVGCVSVHDYSKTRPEDPLPLGKDVTWACAVTAESSLLRGIFKQPNFEPELQKLSTVLEDILKSEPEIHLTHRP